eukprot:6195155-Pleurochrysis_carterae.AAC.1
MGCICRQFPHLELSQCSRLSHTGASTAISVPANSAFNPMPSKLRRSPCVSSVVSRKMRL